MNENNQLLHNSCMSKECQYYLIPRNDFSTHIERLKTVNPEFIHAYHKTIYHNRKSSINQIIEDIVVGKETRGDIKYSRNMVLRKTDDIELNRDIYNAIYDA